MTVHVHVSLSASVALEHSFDGTSYSVRAQRVTPTAHGSKIANADLSEAEMEALQASSCCVYHFVCMVCPGGHDLVQPHVATARLLLYKQGVHCCIRNALVAVRGVVL